jgi:hypothetical protein
MNVTPCSLVYWSVVPLQCYGRIQTALRPEISVNSHQIIRLHIKQIFGEVLG